MPTYVSLQTPKWLAFEQIKRINQMSCEFNCSKIMVIGQGQYSRGSVARINQNMWNQSPIFSVGVESISLYCSPLVLFWMNLRKRSKFWPTIGSFDEKIFLSRYFVVGLKTIFFSQMFIWENFYRSFVPNHPNPVIFYATFIDSYSLKFCLPESVLFWISNNLFEHESR